MFGKNKVVLRLTCLVLCATLLPAQDSSSCLRRTFVVSVTSDESRPVVGLTESNFRGTFKKEPVRILSVEKHSQPNRTVILLDMSGSMERKLPIAGAAVLELIFSARLEDRVAFLAFSDKVMVRLGFEHSRQELAREVQLLGTKGHPGPRGRGALYDAIMEALQLGESPSLLYLVSDGDPDNISKTDEGKMRRALVSSGARLYAILLPDLNPPTLEGTSGPTELSELAEKTGGSATLDHSNGSSESDWKRALTIARDLTTRVAQSYRLEVELPQAPKKREAWKLELVNLPKRKGWVRVSYPRDLMPCTDVGPSR